MIEKLAKGCKKIKSIPHLTGDYILFISPAGAYHGFNLSCCDKSKSFLLRSRAVPSVAVQLNVSLERADGVAYREAQTNGSIVIRGA